MSRVFWTTGDADGYPARGCDNCEDEKSKCSSGRNATTRPADGRDAAATDGMSRDGEAGGKDYLPPRCDRKKDTCARAVRERRRRHRMRTGGGDCKERDEREGSERPDGPRTANGRTARRPTPPPCDRPRSRSLVKLRRTKSARGLKKNASPRRKIDLR
jgi:hypothetical protein